MLKYSKANHQLESRRLLYLAKILFAVDPTHCPRTKKWFNRHRWMRPWTVNGPWTVPKCRGLWPSSSSEFLHLAILYFSLVWKYKNSLEWNTSLLQWSRRFCRFGPPLSGSAIWQYLRTSSSNFWKYVGWKRGRCFGFYLTFGTLIE